MFSDLKLTLLKRTMVVEKLQAAHCIELHDMTKLDTGRTKHYRILFDRREKFPSTEKLGRSILELRSHSHSAKETTDINASVWSRILMNHDYLHYKMMSVIIYQLAHRHGVAHLNRV